MASSGLRENVILTKIIFTTDGTKICVKADMVLSGVTLPWTFEERFFYDHGNTSGHYTSVGNFPIVSREVYSITRTIKEAMHIRVNDPSLDRKILKFQLPHISNEVLQDPLPSILGNTLLLASHNGQSPSATKVGDTQFTFTSLVSMVFP